MARALKAIIDSSALKHNLQHLRLYAPHSRVLAMIKANGYGHGLVPVAKALQEADAFGVACLEEALPLRQAQIQHPILLMEGFFSSDELQDILQFQLQPIIHHAGQITALKAFSSVSTTSAAKIKIWLKVNTGMYRLGFTPEELPGAYAALAALEAVEIQGIMSHFARADELEHPMTSEQLQIFQQLTRSFPQAKSLANSAAILGWQASHHDWVRPGIALYGVSPFADRLGLEFGLKPAMTLASELIAVQQLKKGDTVGYGGIFTCPEPMPVGVVAVGYADGYPRLSPMGTPVCVNGQPVPLIGRVSMDMLTVDLRTQPTAKVGDPVELWGPNLPVETVARVIGTVGYELLTGLSSRVPLEIR